MFRLIGSIHNVNIKMQSAIQASYDVLRYVLFATVLQT